MVRPMARPCCRARQAKHPLQELVPEADEGEALVAYRNALENAMSTPSAAHPIEVRGRLPQSWLSRAPPTGG